MNSSFIALHVKNKVHILFIHSVRDTDRMVILKIIRVNNSHNISFIAPSFSFIAPSNRQRSHSLHAPSHSLPLRSPSPRVRSRPRPQTFRPPDARHPRQRTKRPPQTAAPSGPINDAPRPPRRRALNRPAKRRKRPLFSPKIALHVIGHG